MESNDDGNGLLQDGNLLAQDLAHFGNLKTEFLIFGRLATYGLLREGRLNESVHVCSQVLAIEPGDEDMNRLREHLASFQSKPNASQLIKEEFTKLNASTESPIRRLRRSISDIRSKKLVAIENGVDMSDDNNNPDPNKAVGSESSSSRTGGKSGSEGSGTGCRRSKSMSTSVLQKIQQFEQGANTRQSCPITPSQVRRASKKPIQETVQEEDVLGSTPKPGSVKPRQDSVSSTTSFQLVSIKDEPITPEPESPLHTPINRETKPRNVVPFSAPVEKLVYIVENKADNTNSGTSTAQAQTRAPPAAILASQAPQCQPAHPPSSPVKNAPITVINAKDSPLQRQFGSTKAGSFDNVEPAPKLTTFKSPGAKAEWTELGLKTFPAPKIKQLELEFFNSEIVTCAAIISTDGALLGLSMGFRISNYEIQTLLAGMTDSSYLTGSKLTLGRVQYGCLSGTATVVRARVNNRGVNCTKVKITSTSSSLTVVVLYDHPVLPKPIALLVRRIEAILQADESAISS